MGKTRTAGELVNNVFVNQSGSTSFTGSLRVSGSSNIIGSLNATSLTGSLNYTNLTLLPTLVSGSEQVVSILTSINSYTASTDNKLNNLESKSASVDISLTNINSFTASNENVSLNQYTASNTINVSNLHSYTGSLNNAIQLTGSTVSFLGNIVVYGTQSIINSENLAVADNLIYLNNTSQVTNPDLGVVGNYNDGVYAHAGIFRDASDGGTWKVFEGYNVEPSGTIDTTGNGFALADFKADVITATTLVGSINSTNGVVSGSSQVVEILSSLNTYTGSNDTTNTTQNGRLTSLENKTGSLATTGSNIFLGNQTITGSIYTTGTGSNLMNLVTTQALSSGYNDATFILAPNQTGGGLSFNIGKSASSYNLGKMVFNYVGDQSTSNNISFGFYNYDNKLVIEGGGTVRPGSNGTQDLGSSSNRWSTVYTSDLSLNNGIGDWTIVEGEDDLFLYNNKKGKVYKFALTEVDPSVATPKKS